MSASDSRYDPRRWQANTAERPRRPFTRWVLLAGLLFVITIPIIAMFHPPAPYRLLPDGAAPMSMLLIVGAAFSPFAHGAFMTEKGLARYDERDRAALLTAGRRAFYANILLVAGVFVWLAIGRTAGWPVPHLANQWTAVGFALVIAMSALPTIIAEFTVPMPADGNRPM